MAAPTTVVSLSHDGSSWTTITSYVAGNTGGGLAFSRGRNRVLGEWVPGVWSASIRNWTRALDPTNQAATFSPRPGDHVKIEVGGVAAFRGRVDTMRIGYRQAATRPDSTLYLAGSDEIALFARLTEDYSYGACAQGGTRLENQVLYTEYVVPGGTVDFDTGTVYLSPPQAGANLLTECQNTVKGEGGQARLFASKAGTPTFHDKNHRATVTASFGGVGEIPYRDIVVDYTDDEWATRATVTPANYTISGTSTTSLTVGTGTKTYTEATAPNETPAVGMYVSLDSSGSSALLEGQITAVSGVGSLTVTVNVTTTAGSGTHTDWVTTYTPQPAAQTATDDDAETLYGVGRSTSATLPLRGNTEALNRAALIAATNGHPSKRVASIDVELAGLTSGQQDSVLALEIGDAATVTFDLGTGTPDTLVQTRWVDGIAHTVPGNGTHVVRLTFGDAPTYTFTAELQQNGVAVAATTRDASYVITPDGWVRAHLVLDPTAAGSAGTAITIVPTGLPDPFSPLFVKAGDHGGSFIYTDSGTYYQGVVVWNASDITMFCHGETGFLGVDPSFAVASGDRISIEFSYRHI